MSGVKDIFGNDSSQYPRIKGGIRFSGAAVMAFDDGSGPVMGPTAPGQQMNNVSNYNGMIIQNYQVSYQQNVTKLRGLNTNGVTAVVTPPTGTFQLGSALTGESGYFKFLGKYGNACYTETNAIHIQAEGVEMCDQSGNLGKGSLPKLTMQGCLISQVQFSQNIENLILSSNMAFEFVALDYVDSSGGSPLPGLPGLPGMTS